MPATRLITKYKAKTPSPREVWIVEDDAMLSRVVTRVLESRGIACRAFNSVTDFLEHFKNNQTVDYLLLLDYYLDDKTGLDLVRHLERRGHRFNFVVMTGRGDEHLAVEIMKSGALDYVVKTPNFLDHLPLAIQQAFERIDLQRKLQQSQQVLRHNLRKQKRLNARIIRQQEALKQEQARSRGLLSNILPERIAAELLFNGTAKARYYSCVSVLFADVEDFSSLASSYSPIELVQKLDDYFCAFDSIIDQFSLEKIKTIGDCYMCAGGIPDQDPVNPWKMVLAALQMQQLINDKAQLAKKNGHRAFDFRIGIHTGEVVAGVVGRKKFAYDIWGDAANTASWIVQAGEVNRVNISRSTFSFVGEFFECRSRGGISVKNHKKVELFLVSRLKKEFAADGRGVKPNKLFWEKVLQLQGCQ
jgi:class 3 adenylate cyclase